MEWFGEAVSDCKKGLIGKGANEFRLLTYKMLSKWRLAVAFVISLCIEIILQYRVLSSKTFQFSSVQSLSHVRLCNPMDCNTPGFPVHRQLLDLAQIHVHWFGDAIQPSHPRSSPSPPAFNLSQHQDLFQWVSSLHHMAKGLELQLQHQSFQWIFRVYFL